MGVSHFFRDMIRHPFFPPPHPSRPLIISFLENVLLLQHLGSIIDGLRQPPPPSPRHLSVSLQGLSSQFPLTPQSGCSRQIPTPPLLPPFFPTTLTSSMTHPLSTPLHISTTVNVAPTTPVSASISTPVFAVVSTWTDMRTPPYIPIGSESCNDSSMVLSSPSDATIF